MHTAQVETGLRKQATKPRPALSSEINALQFARLAGVGRYYIVNLVKRGVLKYKRRGKCDVYLFDIEYAERLAPLVNVYHRLRRVSQERYQ